MSRCGVKKEGEEKMRKNISEKFDATDYKALERYLHVIGVNINEYNEQMEEVY